MTQPQKTPEGRAKALANLNYDRAARHRGKLTLTDGMHPLTRRLFEEVNDQCATIDEIAKRSGVNRHTFSRWRWKTHPRLDNLQAALNVLGLELVIRKRRGDS